MMAFWDMTALTSSYWGMYAVQTVLHSLIASVLVECAFMAWDIKAPSVKQRFRFMVILLPLLSFPVYQWISPRRGDAYFRLESLADSNKWFYLGPWNTPPIAVLFIILLAISSLIFIVQELLPIVFQMREQTRVADEPAADALENGMARKVSLAVEGLPFDERSVEILNDDDLVLFSDTGLNPRIYVSTGLIATFTIEHLQAALAHEIGHIQRTRKPVLIFAYILRMLMFYNPVIMVEFRKMAQEEENVCDDIAVALTGKPEALSEAVDLFRSAAEEHGPGASGIASSLEQYSHNVLLKNRVLRIGQRREDDSPWSAPYFVTLALIVSINYFVV
jgi:Zn-dependent protease with chaperone function